MASDDYGGLNDFSTRWGPEKTSKRRLIKESKVHRQEVTFHTEPNKAFPGKQMTQLLSDFELEECKEAFGIFDTNGSGLIQATDLHKLLRIVDQDQTCTEVQNLLAEKCTEEGTKAISFSEFLSLMSQLRNEEDDDEDLREAFVMLDPNHTGSIDTQKMKDTMIQLGYELTKADIDGMVREADLNGDGRVTFKEFCRVMNASQ